MHALEKNTMTDLLHPDNLRSVAGLELAARRTVATLLPGINLSRRTGAGQEFSQYRSYQPGDDLRRLDWKLYARSDRFYIREAPLETNITVRFVLDASASMRHADHSGLLKLDYARYLIATLAWLAMGQGDELAFYALNDYRTYQLTPRSGRQYFQRLLHELLQVEAGGRFPADKNIETLLSGNRHRELIIFLTDLHEEREELSLTLRRLSRTRHEIIVFHLMGRNELELDYQGVFQFEDLENHRSVQVDIARARKAYRARLEAHLAAIRRNMMEWRIQYARMAMDEMPGEALRRFLQERNRLKG